MADSLDGVPVYKAVKYAEINGVLTQGVDKPLNYVTYSDATYTYYCESPVGTDLSTAGWQVSRKTNSTGDILYAGTGKFEHAATNITVVGNLTYTLGA